MGTTSKPAPRLGRPFLQQNRPQKYKQKAKQADPKRANRGALVAPSRPALPHMEMMQIHYVRLIYLLHLNGQQAWGALKTRKRPQNIPRPGFRVEDEWYFRSKFFVWSSFGSSCFASRIQCFVLLKTACQVTKWPAKSKKRPVKPKNMLA